MRFTSVYNPIKASKLLPFYPIHPNSNRVAHAVWGYCKDTVIMWKCDCELELHLVTTTTIIAMETSSQLFLADPRVMVVTCDTHIHAYMHSLSMWLHSVDISSLLKFFLIQSRFPMSLEVVSSALQIQQEVQSKYVLCLKSKYMLACDKVFCYMYSGFLHLLMYDILWTAGHLNCVFMLEPQ